jgi:hypothetical protein
MLYIDILFLLIKVYIIFTTLKSPLQGRYVHYLSNNQREFKIWWNTPLNKFPFSETNTKNILITSLMF